MKVWTEKTIIKHKLDKPGAEYGLGKVLISPTKDKRGAVEVAAVLSQIDPLASCQLEVENFIKSVDSKLKADEKARWEFKIKQFEDRVAKEKEQIRIAEEKSIRDDNFRENQAVNNLKLDKIHVNAYRKVAIEYPKNQPKIIYYNNIYWR